MKDTHATELWATKKVPSDKNSMFAMRLEEKTSWANALTSILNKGSATDNIQHTIEKTTSYVQWHFFFTPNIIY